MQKHKNQSFQHLMDFQILLPLVEKDKRMHYRQSKQLLKELLLFLNPPN